MVKTIMPNLTHTKKEKQKKGDKYGKALYKLMNNAAYDKTIENLRNRIDVRLANNKIDHLKQTSKSSYLSQKNI